MITVETTCINHDVDPLFVGNIPWVIFVRAVIHFFLQSVHPAW